MFQPLRGLYLFCTQKRAHFPRTDQQLHLPSFLNKVPCSFRSFFSSAPLSLSSLLPSSSHRLLRTFPPSLQELDSLSPSLNNPPSLAHSAGQHSLTDAYHSWEKDELCFQFDVRAVVCGAMSASGNVCTM